MQQLCVPFEQKTILPTVEVLTRGQFGVFEEHDGQYHFPVSASPRASFFFPPMLCPTKNPLLQSEQVYISLDPGRAYLACFFVICFGSGTIDMEGSGAMIFSYTSLALSLFPRFSLHSDSVIPVKGTLLQAPAPEPETGVHPDSLMN